MPAARDQSSNNPGIHKLLRSLEKLKLRNKKDKDLQFLYGLLQSPDIQALLEAYNKVSSGDIKNYKPVSTKAAETSHKVQDEVSLHRLTDETEELLSILSSHHMTSLLQAHDVIARRDYEPSLPDICQEVDEEDCSVKIVQLVKGKEPLGATIRLNEEYGTIEIARVLHGGAADRSGLIHVGDEVHEINGTNIRGRDPDDVVQILANVRGPVVFKLCPAQHSESKRLQEAKVHMRAHFDYDPLQDSLIPCREAGLPFKKGDILHIVDQEDPHWWQACREGDQRLRAGLIPGRLLQERKATQRTSVGLQGGVYRERGNRGIRSSVIGIASPGRLRKKLSQSKEQGKEEIITYKEVAKYFPVPGKHRPVVLVGPPGVGRNALKTQLIASNSKHFVESIPYTSRPKKADEMEDRDYHFVLPLAEHKGSLYCTSKESILSTIHSGRVGVVTPQPESLQALYTAEIKPYIIFIKPPAIERLRDTRLYTQQKASQAKRIFCDEELHEMIQNAHSLESLYGHYFDKTTINDDFQTALSELSTAAYQIEHEVQWVPITWLND